MLPRSIKLNSSLGTHLNFVHSTSFSVVRTYYDKP